MTASHNRVAVLHGVNFDILERRDPEMYGGLSLYELETKIERWAHEGEFVEYLHRAPELADAALVNAGAWTHYSRAIADALAVAGLPAVEVHLSDVESREDWRRISVFDGLVLAKVSGKGPDGYRDALERLADELGTRAG
jgi:3-dehydroquinate dehydratase-2